MRCEFSKWFHSVGADFKHHHEKHFPSHSVIGTIPKLPPIVSLEQGEEASHMVRLHLNHLHLIFSLIPILVLTWARGNLTHERSAGLPVPLRPIDLVLRHVDLTSHREDPAQEQLANSFEAVFLQYCKHFFAEWLGWFGYVADEVCCFCDRFTDECRLPVGTYRASVAMDLVIGAIIWQIVV